MQLTNSLLMGIYLKEIVNNCLNLEIKPRWDVDFKLILEPKSETWYIHPQVDFDFQYPDWVLDKAREILKENKDGLH